MWNYFSIPKLQLCNVINIITYPCWLNRVSKWRPSSQTLVPLCIYTTIKYIFAWPPIFWPWEITCELRSHTGHNLNYRYISINNSLMKITFNIKDIKCTDPEKIRHHKRLWIFCLSSHIYDNWQWIKRLFPQRRTFPVVSTRQTRWRIRFMRGYFQHHCLFILPLVFLSYLKWLKIK